MRALLYLYFVLIIVVSVTTTTRRVGPPSAHAGRDAQAKTEIQNIRDIIQFYAQEKGNLPNELSDLTQPGDNYLKNVGDGGIPVDPWQREYRYARGESNNDDGFVIWSLGKEEGDETDDIRSDSGCGSRRRQPL